MWRVCVDSMGAHHAAAKRRQCSDAGAPLQPSVRRRLIRRQLCTVQEPRQERPVPPTRPMGARLASAHAMARSRPIQTLLLLWVLYCVQGLPFGFQSKSLPLLLRERGFTLRHIGYANLLSAPWTCKFLVSPFVDRWGASSSWGRRRVWILPMQCCLIVACLLAAAIFESVELLMPVILAMNICTATMDVAVDGLALDVLSGENELGWGNVAQAVGYKMGMIVGGGVLMQIAELTGMAWPGFFLYMAGIVALALIPLLLYPEATVDDACITAQALDSTVPTYPFSCNLAPYEYHPIDGHVLARAASSPLPGLQRRASFERASSSPPRDPIRVVQASEEVPTRSGRGHAMHSRGTPPDDILQESDSPSDTPQLSESQSSIRGVMSTLCRQIQTPGGVTTLMIVFSYKIGEAVSDNMFKPYLLDQGFSKAQILMWTGVYGMGFSTAGSLAGGFVLNQLAKRRARQELDGKSQEPAAGGSNSVLLGAVALASALEAVAQLGRLFAACASAEALSSGHGQLALQALIMYESFCGGLLTTIIFTYMMASVDKSIGATHYTLLSTVELAGKSIPSITSGLLAEAVGYQYVFAIGAGCSVLFVLCVVGIMLRSATATVKAGKTQ